MTFGRRAPRYRTQVLPSGQTPYRTRPGVSKTHVCERGCWQVSATSNQRLADGTEEGLLGSPCSIVAPPRASTSSPSVSSCGAQLVTGTKECIPSLTSSRFCWLKTTQVAYRFFRNRERRAEGANRSHRDLPVLRWPDVQRHSCYSESGQKFPVRGYPDFA